MGFVYLVRCIISRDVSDYYYLVYLCFIVFIIVFGCRNIMLLFC